MLHAGFASVEVTPPREVSLLGYDFRAERLPPGNAGVRDALAVRALALSDDAGVPGSHSDTAAVVLLDLDQCILSLALAGRWRQAVAARLGLDASAVILACTHTHSGPELADDGFGTGFGDILPATAAGMSATAQATPSNQHTERLAGAVIEAAECAFGLRTPVIAAAASAPLGLAYTRRVLRPGTEHVALCWNPREQHHLAPGPSADPTLAVLVLRPVQGGAPIVVMNHGAHPVVLGKTSRLVSADYPGEALHQLAALIPGARGCFLLGACGDTHPWIATQDDPAAPALVGGALAHLAALLVHAARPDPRQRLCLRTSTGSFGSVQLPLTTLRIGPAVCAAAPVELFAGLGAALRAATPDPLLLATNANGWSGYWPDRAAFAAGGYEVAAARAYGRNPGDGEALIAQLGEMLRSREVRGPES